MPDNFAEQAEELPRFPRDGKYFIFSAPDRGYLLRPRHGWLVPNWATDPIRAVLGQFDKATQSNLLGQVCAFFRVLERNRVQNVFSTKAIGRVFNHTIPSTLKNKTAEEFSSQLALAAYYIDQRKIWDSTWRNDLQRDDPPSLPTILSSSRSGFRPSLGCLQGLPRLLEKLELIPTSKSDSSGRFEDFWKDVLPQLVEYSICQQDFNENLHCLVKFVTAWRRLARLGWKGDWRDIFRAYAEGIASLQEFKHTLSALQNCAISASEELDGKLTTDEVGPLLLAIANVYSSPEDISRTFEEVIRKLRHLWSQGIRPDLYNIPRICKGCSRPSELLVAVDLWIKFILRASDGKYVKTFYDALRLIPHNINFYELESCLELLARLSMNENIYFQGQHFLVDREHRSTLTSKEFEYLFREILEHREKGVDYELVIKPEVGHWESTIETHVVGWHELESYMDVSVDYYCMDSPQLINLRWL